MVKHSGAVFKPLRFEFGKIHVAGGYTSKPMAMVTKTVDGPDGQQKDIREDVDHGGLVDSGHMRGHPSKRVVIRPNIAD